MRFGGAATRGAMVDRTAAALAAAFWLASLELPALRINGVVSTGVTFFLIGPLGVLVGYPDWLGNVALLAAEAVIWFRGPRGWRLGVAVALLLLALIAGTRRALPTDEGGMPHEITARLPGFYLWLASLLIPIAALLRGGGKETSR